MNNDLLTLITVLKEVTDDNGLVTAEETAEVEIFAYGKSAARSEYYAALQNGYKAKVIFEVDADDFELSAREIRTLKGMKKVKASRIRHNGMVYRIVRDYRNPQKGNLLELTCEEVE